MAGKLSEEIIAKFEQRLELMAEVFELAQRQHRCIEEGRTERLDRLIRRRDHALRRWQQIEDALSSDLKTAAPARTTLDAAQKERLLDLVSRADELVEALRREDTLIAGAMDERKVSIEEEIQAVRQEREALRAYSRDVPASPPGGVDRSA
ncbi:MAG: flagellar export chaperone FlgN [Verrucomicrobia bacterium]|nr:flagellar export chaperone FlgN [Verrucomicrobiota bacterium]